MSERVMYRCQHCGTTTAQSRACPFCNAKALEEVSSDD